MKWLFRNLGKKITVAISDMEFRGVLYGFELILAKMVGLEGMYGITVKEYIEFTSGRAKKE